MSTIKQKRRCKRHFGMPRDTYLPWIPEGWTQLDAADYIRAGDQVFGRFEQTWHPIKPDSIRVGTSAGNTCFCIREIDGGAK